MDPTVNSSIESKLKYRRIYNSISYHGYDISALKSAVQKWCRRRELSKIYWVIKEIYLFFQLATDEKKPTGRAIVTNLINRFIVIMNEEMLFTDVNRYILCMEYINEFELSDRKDMRYLLAIGELIESSRMCRRNSYCRSYWSDKEWDIDDPSKEEMYKNFVCLFDRKDECCFYWLFRLLKGDFLCETKRFRRREYIYVIWKYLFDLEIVKKNLNVKKVLEYRLKEFFNKDRKERFMFLTSAVDICMFYSPEEDRDYQDLKKEYDVKVSGFEKEVDVKLHAHLKLDDYVYDMHTKEGKDMGRTAIDFKKVGCIVFLEDNDYLRAEWKAFYLNFIRPKVGKKRNRKSSDLEQNPSVIVRKPDKKRKKNFDNILSKLVRGSVTFNLSNMEVCEHRRVGGKAPCFEYPCGSGKIYKEGRQTMGYNIDYCLFQMIKQLFGLKAIGMYLIESNQCLKNSEEGYVLENRRTIYSCMEKIPGVMLEKRKNELQTNPDMIYEYCKIGIIRGIFGMSDFNPRNIFVRPDNALVSLDEHDMGGKRSSFFNIKSKICLEYLKSHEEVLEKICREIESVDFEDCRKLMIEYEIEEEIINKIKRNYENAYDIVKEEIKNI